MRLNRSRKGKTPVDIVIIEQGPQKRVRLTVGEDASRPSNKKNTDLDQGELEDLITLLTYHLMKIRGEIKEEEPG